MTRNHANSSSLCWRIWTKAELWALSEAEDLWNHVEPREEPGRNSVCSLDLQPSHIILITMNFLSHDQAVSVMVPVQVYITTGQSYELETKLRRLEQSAKNRFGGTTDSELSELEDVVALTAARVQSAESEVGRLCHVAQIFYLSLTDLLQHAEKMIGWTVVCRFLVLHCVCLLCRCQTSRAKLQL